MSAVGMPGRFGAVPRHGAGAGARPIVEIYRPQHRRAFEDFISSLKLKPNDGARN